MIQVVTIGDEGYRGSIEGEEERPQDGTLRDATGKFDRIGLHVVHRHYLESVVQTGLKPGKSSALS